MTSVHLLKQAAIAEPLEVRPRDTPVVEVTRTYRALAGEPEQRGGLVRGGGWHDT